MPPRDFDPNAYVPADVHGWTTFAAVYADAVDLADPGSHFVEVGSWLGKSAITLAKLVRRSGKDIRITCVDTFCGSESDRSYFSIALKEHNGDVRKAFDANLTRHGVREWVDVLQLPSVKAAATFADESLDFVFIDADHAYECVRDDLQAWLPKVKPTGILAGHDWGYLGVERAVREALPVDELLLTGDGQTWLWQKPAAALASPGPLPAASPGACLPRR